MVFLSTQQTAKIDAILRDAVTAQKTPALSLGFVTANSPIYMRHYGTKLFDDPSSEAITEDTVYWMCSQTKLITSLAGLKLIEQGKIQLDTPVETILPELANPVVATAHDATGAITASRPAVGKITFGQLLNHSSGLDYFVDGRTFASGIMMHDSYSHSYKDQDVSEFFKILQGPLAGVPLRFDPGTSFAYGFSSDCIGFIVERLSGQSLEQYFKEYIFSPLGVTSASFYLTPELKERLLPLSFRRPDGTIERWPRPPVIEAEPAHIKVHLGGVGLYATQKDYLKILQHLLEILAGTASHPILSVSSVASLFAETLTPAGAEQAALITSPVFSSIGVPTGNSQFGNGLAVLTADAPGHRKKGSGLWGGWASTSYFIDPASGVAMVFGTQLAPTGDEIVQRVWAELEGVVYTAVPK
ncbi:hypothetical protein MIND_00867300 [Mycena indigotica]|uniref:Beta-lactamase-related domain-containing protein n=1 Tax=Mycena indigotica TaxID=2126181 RepID=A0A8H6SIB2_9AGAR|nr:uncharacterized protein MIND_00867300 [Mycena indigotica]KAF7299186.1 hypothetical protein MIND_00867300 [Mycena indigotica]